MIKQVLTIAALSIFIVAVIVIAIPKEATPAPQQPTPKPSPVTQQEGYIWQALAASGRAPKGAVFAAVWTGRTLLVIGRDTLSAYDPAHQTWSRRAAPPAGSGRWLVWDGDLALLFGGTGAGPWHYDPATDRWQALQAAGGGPDSSGIVAAAWDGHAAIVLARPAGGAAGTVWFFDPLNNVWTSVRSVGDLPPPLRSPATPCRCTTLWDGEELLLLSPVWGISAFAPLTGTWRALARGAVDQLRDGTPFWDGTEVLSVHSRVADRLLWSFAPDADRSWRWAGQAVIAPRFGFDLVEAAAWTGQRALILSGDPTGSIPVSLWSLRQAGPLLQVSAEAGSGPVLGPAFYVNFTIAVRNAGTLPADDVQLRVILPGNAEYEPYSTLRDSSPVPDEAGGRSALQAGLGIGNLLPGTGTQVSISARVSATARDGDPFVMRAQAWIRGHRTVTEASTFQSIALVQLPASLGTPVVTAAATQLLTATRPTAQRAVHGSPGPATRAAATRTEVAPRPQRTATRPARPTAAPPASRTPQATLRATATRAATATRTATATAPPPATASPTRTPSPTRAPTSTAVPTSTPTPTALPTATATAIPTATAPPSATASQTPLPTAIPTPIATFTPPPTNTQVATDTPPPDTATATPTALPTSTPMPTSTVPPSPTPLAVPTSVPTLTPLPTSVPPTLTATPAPLTPATTPAPTSSP